MPAISKSKDMFDAGYQGALFTELLKMVPFWFALILIMGGISLAMWIISWALSHLNPYRVPEEVEE